MKNGILTLILGMSFATGNAFSFVYSTDSCIEVLPLDRESHTQEHFHKTSYNSYRELTKGELQNLVPGFEVKEVTSSWMNFHGGISYFVENAEGKKLRVSFGIEHKCQFTVSANYDLSWKKVTGEIRYIRSDYVIITNPLTLIDIKIKLLDTPELKFLVEEIYP